MIQNRLWTEGEREYLRKYYQVYSLSKLAFALHRTKAAVATQARLMRIRKIKFKIKARPASEILVWDIKKPLDHEKNENS